MSNTPMFDAFNKATVLSQALPYMRRYNGRTFVVKYGGHAMGDETRAQQFAHDMVLLKLVGINPIVVHGGGPQIATMLSRLGIKSEFVDGLRITDAATVDIVEMVLCGDINKSIAADIGRAGGTAIGLSGKDGGLIEAQKIRPKPRGSETKLEKMLDLGFVGEPVRINTAVLNVLTQSDIIPVIAPIGLGKDGETYNINADTAAGAIAAAMGAARLLLLTDTVGVLDSHKTLIDTMTRTEAEALIADGTISGGMIPKIETCLNAVDNGVEAAVILDGRVPHATLLETFTEDGAGTMITKLL